MIHVSWLECIHFHLLLNEAPVIIKNNHLWGQKLHFFTFQSKGWKFVILIMKFWHFNYIFHHSVTKFVRETASTCCCAIFLSYFYFSSLSPSPPSCLFILLLSLSLSLFYLSVLSSALSSLLPVEAFGSEAHLADSRPVSCQLRLSVCSGVSCRSLLSHLFQTLESLTEQTVFYF